MSRIYVGNLPFQSQENSLRNLFAQYGNVREVRIITDAETGRSRGFAFVEMSTQAEAARAIEALGAVGPTGNYADVPAAGKVVLSALMLMGRLEIYSVLVLFLGWRFRR